MPIVNKGAILESASISTIKKEKTSSSDIHDPIIDPFNLNLAPKGFDCLSQYINLSSGQIFQGVHFEG